MKLLFVHRFPPVPHAGVGSATLTWAQLEALRHQHELSVISFKEEGPAALESLSNAGAFFEKQAIQYRSVPLPMRRWDWRLARIRAAMLDCPINAVIYRSPRMTDAIRDTIRAFAPDAVVLQDPPMAQYVGACGSTPAFMDVQDAYSVSAYRSIAAAGTRREERQLLNEWLRWVRYEQDHYGRFRAVLAVSDQDSYGLKAFSPQLNVTTVGVPLALAAARHSPRRTNTIRFVGYVRHAPNSEAVRHFVTRVFPRIRELVPPALFEVAGKDAPPDLTDQPAPGVTFVGFVADLASFFAEATVVAIPLLSGGGIKLKTLEALATGAAVVSTSIGVEGLGGEDGEHFLVRDTPESMAEAIAALLSQPERAQRLGEQGRTLVETRFSPEAWEARFMKVIRRGLAKPVSRGA